ncbi:MAG: phosphotransferase family protein [Ktedonobacterales bacterium]
MQQVSDQPIVAYLRQHAIAGLDGALRIEPLPADFDGQRFRVMSGSVRAVLNRYNSTAIESARREIAGLHLGSGVGLAPALLLGDDAGEALGGPVVISEEPAGTALGSEPLDAGSVQGWLFLLLTLHHLPATGVTLSSSMSQDAATWWQRTQSAWSECRTAYGDAAFGALMQALSRLHAIVGARIEANRSLWNGVTRRLCHGNPVPAHIVRAGGRLMLIEWEGFGLGDPAMEVGRAAALAALSGEIDADHYVRFVADYLTGMRDPRDTTLENRLHIFASVLPLGFCFVVLRLLAQRGALSAAERERSIAQVTRALMWIQDTLGVEVGDPAQLLAPVRQLA